MSGFETGAAYRVAYDCAACGTTRYLGLVVTAARILQDGPYHCMDCGADDPHYCTYRVVMQERSATGRYYAFLPWQLEKLPPLDEPAETYTSQPVKETV